MLPARRRRAAGGHGRRVESTGSVARPTGCHRLRGIGRDELLTIFQLSASATAPPKVVAEGWAHSAVVKSVEWSPDERQLVSIGIDACICVWNFFGSSMTKG